MNSDIYENFCDWLPTVKNGKWKDKVVCSLKDGLIYCKCAFCPFITSIVVRNNGFDINHFSRHLNRQTLECPDRQNVLDFSTSSSADHIMETEDVSSILS